MAGAKNNPEVGEFLELPCVSNVVAIEVVDDQHLKVTRLGDTGTELLELILIGEVPAMIKHV